MSNIDALTQLRSDNEGYKHEIAFLQLNDNARQDFHRIVNEIIGKGRWGRRQAALQVQPLLKIFRYDFSDVESRVSKHLTYLKRSDMPSLSMAYLAWLCLYYPDEARKFYELSRLDQSLPFRAFKGDPRHALEPPQSAAPIGYVAENGGRVVGSYTIKQDGGKPPVVKNVTIGSDEQSDHREAMKRIDEEYTEKSGCLSLDRLNIRFIPNTIEKLVWLETLDLTLSKIDHIAVEKLPSLSSLMCGGTNLTSLRGLEHASKLNHLDVNDTSVSSLNMIVFTPDLYFLSACRTKISDITDLKFCSKLENLYISFTNVSDLVQLEFCPGLCELDITGTPVKSIEALRICSLLESISFSKTDISDLSPILELKGVKRLEMADTKIRSLMGIERYSNLVYLDISRCCIEELNPDIFQMPSLQYVLAHEADIKGIPSGLLDSDDNHATLLRRFVSMKAENSH